MIVSFVGIQLDSSSGQGSVVNFCNCAPERRLHRRRDRNSLFRRLLVRQSAEAPSTKADY
jgi:hypothetical protein